jgi:hypothetical protein
MTLHARASASFLHLLLRHVLLLGSAAFVAAGLSSAATIMASLGAGAGSVASSIILSGSYT